MSDGESTVHDPERAKEIEGRTVTLFAILIDYVDKELKKQTEKWGTQDHDPGLWSLILIEEVGEYAQAVLQGRTDDSIKEAVQIIAVLTRMVEKTIRQAALTALTNDATLSSSTA